MKSLSFAIPLALAGLSFAQLSSLPTCAQGCANIFLSGGIGNCGRDPACICADSSFIASISCCLVGACDAADQQKAIDFAQQICQANKVSVPNTVSCSSTVTTGAAASTASTSPASATATTTTTTTSSTPASSSSAASSSSSASAASSSASQASASSSASSSSSGNFGPRQTAAPFMGALGGIVAVAALL